MIETIIGIDNPDNPRPKNVLQQINDLVATFRDESNNLTKALGHYFIYPPELNTLNNTYNRVIDSVPEDIQALIENTIPHWLPVNNTREGLLNTESIQQLRKIATFIKCAGALSKQTNAREILSQIAEKMDGGELNPLISTSEMARVRNSQGITIPQNFEQIILKNKDTMLTDPAIEVFSAQINSGIPLDEAIATINDQFSHDHVAIEMMPMDGGGMKPDFGFH